MKEMLEHLFSGASLKAEEARSVLKDIASQKYPASQVAAFLTVFRMRTLTVDELEGFRNALLDLCIRVDLSDYDLIDIVGTGGDGKNTFNISTCTAFVIAGSGSMVAKHGNYAASSICGSSSVLEALGVELSTEVGVLKRNLEDAGICFLHAPLFHPSLKHVAPVRREMGVMTFFNVLGPLVNPAQPESQMLGVCSSEVARLYSYLLQRGSKRYVIVHSLDGYDEVSLTGPVRLISNQAEALHEVSDLGFETVAKEMLQGGDSIEASAEIFLKILDGEGTAAQNQVVIANAGVALQCFHPEASPEDCFAIAQESLESGAARNALRKLTGEQT